MNVPVGMELTEKDFELLMEAIGDYEKAPMYEALVGGVVRKMAGADFEKGPDMDVVERGERDSRARKSICIILRAKLELARQALQSAAISAPEGAA